jgi:magnesium-transporting ATPase (P-type)
MFVTDYAVHTASLTWDATGVHSIAQVSQSASQQIRSLSGLCNAAEFDGKSQHLPLSERPIFGDATDQAILRFSERFGPVSETRQNWKSFYALAFDSKNKFMVKTFTPANSESPKMSLSPPEASRFQSGDMYVVVMFDLILGQN